MIHRTPSPTWDRPPIFRPGADLGAYVVVRRLGLGGMGEVYEGHLARLPEKRVALKVLFPEFARDPEVVKRFRREGEASARIRHPHVVRVENVGEEDGFPFLVMELLEGRDLRSTLEERQVLSVQEAVDLALPVISALGAAHDRGIVHRDLKPENIFLETMEFGTSSPKVLDFGISKLAETKSVRRLTGGNSLLGTVHYMSPEQAWEPQTVDARSDQFSLGVILYECVAGRVPFLADSTLHVLMAVRERAPTPLGLLRPDLPEAFVAAIDRVLEKRPAARFAHVRELGAVLFPLASARTQAIFADEFKGATESRGFSVHRPPHAPARRGSGFASAPPVERTRTAPRTTRQRSLWIVPALGALSVLFGWMLSGSGEETREEGVHAAAEPLGIDAADAFADLRSAGFSLETRPSGAKVYVNGALLDARTPIAISDLEPGSYTLRVEHGERYAPWQMQLELRPGEHLRIPRAMLALRTASVQFRSEPPGATIVLARGRERRVLGASPTTAEIDVSGAPWTVTMRKGGYASWSATLVIPNGVEEHSIHAHLARRGHASSSVVASPPVPTREPPAPANGPGDPLDNPYR